MWSIVCHPVIWVIWVGSFLSFCLHEQLVISCCIEVFKFLVIYYYNFKTFKIEQIIGNKETFGNRFITLNCIFPARQYYAMTTRSFSF